MSSAIQLSRSSHAERLKEHSEVLSTEQAAFERRGRWSEYFAQRLHGTFSGKVVFEIGCFDAEFLCRIAAKHPQVGFVGLDWKCTALIDGAARIEQAGLVNVHLLRARAQDVSKLFAPRELDEMWIFHPEPCDRAVELKNRLINESFLVHAHESLRDANSIIALKTDHPGYYQWVLGFFGEQQPEWFANAAYDRPHPKLRRRDLMRPADIPAPSPAIRNRFSVACNSFDFWADPSALSHSAGRLFSGEQTLFENRFVKKRQPIYYFEMRKVIG